MEELRAWSIILQNTGATQTYLMEPDIIPEVWVAIQLRVPTVGGTSTLCVTTENMDDPVLDLLRHLNEVHVVPAAGGTLDLEIVAIVLVESLQTLDQEEVDSKP